MNVELLRQVQDQILAHPACLDMRLFINRGLLAPVTECGTTACITGWAGILSSGRSYTNEHMGAEDLEITEAQALRLFYNTMWPAKYENAFEVAKTAKERACVTAARIEHFIETDGAE